MRIENHLQILKQKIVEANIFIPRPELVQSTCGQWEETIMNDKVLIIAIFSLLGIGVLSVLFIAVPWLVNYALPNWRDSLLDSGIVMIAVGLFVYGFYMNTRMHK